MTTDQYLKKKKNRGEGLETIVQKNFDQEFVDVNWLNLL